MREKFKVKVGVHQVSVFNPFLFVIVMEILTSEIRGLSWKILYADELMLVAENKESLKKKELVWKKQLVDKGMRLNI